MNAKKQHFLIAYDLLCILFLMIKFRSKTWSKKHILLSNIRQFSQSFSKHYFHSFWYSFSELSSHIFCFVLFSLIVSSSNIAFYILLIVNLSGHLLVQHKFVADRIILSIYIYLTLCIDFTNYFFVSVFSCLFSYLFNGSNNQITLFWIPITI